MQILVIGDSHVRAMMRALRSEPEIRERITALNVLRPFRRLAEPFFELEGGTLRFTDPRFEAKLELLTGATTIELDPGTQYIAVMPFTMTLILRAGTWTTFRPSWILDESRKPLSSGLLEQVVRDRYRHGLDLLTRMKAAGVPVAVLESPPPRADDPWNERCGERTILELNRFARGVVAAWLDGLGIDVIPVPDEVYEGEPGLSFLKKKFGATWEGDYHHANVRYGRLALREVVAYTDARRPADS